MEMPSSPNQLRASNIGGELSWLEQRTENPCVSGSNPLLSGRRVQRKEHVARGESQNPIVPFAFLFLNRESRQTGHYGKTWKHPIPFRPRSVESSCAICTEIVRETWSQPEMEFSNFLISSMPFRKQRNEWKKKIEYVRSSKNRIFLIFRFNKHKWRSTFLFIYLFSYPSCSFFCFFFLMDGCPSHEKSGFRFWIQQEIPLSNKSRKQLEGHLCRNPISSSV